LIYALHCLLRNGNSLAFFNLPGPAEFITGKIVDVHPHIDLTTTYFIAIDAGIYRDNLGSNK
jgi:redox-sensitive bicupin YhaK (pirin superfamily)